MASSAVSSVFYSRDATGNHTETPTGAKNYYGDSASFHEWECHTRLRIAGKTGHQKNEALSKVCDGVRGDAFVAAQEVGFDNLCEIVDGRSCGIDTPISNICEEWFSLHLNMDLKKCSASTAVLDDPCPDKMERV